MDLEINIKFTLHFYESFPLFFKLKTMMEGVVIKSTGILHTILDSNDNIYLCTLKGSEKLKKLPFTNPISVGDKVFFSLEDNSNKGVIEKIKPRINYVIRKSVNLSKRSQIIASNIDLCILLVTIKDPVTTLLFIDRFLVTLDAYKIPTILVFNKIDLHDEKTKIIEETYKSIYNKIGIDTISVSILEGKNINILKDCLKNKTTLISGHSGVGKTSLINLLDGSLDLKVKEISEYHKQGVHTTTFARMLKINTLNGFIVDTPGIRGFGLVDISRKMLSNYFPEMKKASCQCKFNDCLHINEPKCNVIISLKNGLISESRYKNYLNMLDDSENYRYNKYKK